MTENIYGEGLIADAGLILACVGCCCGHAERGGPKTPPGTLKRELRRAFRRADLGGRVRLAFSDCLGPCSEANVVFLYWEGRPLWLRGALDGGPRALPPELAGRSFAWTGGGEGPAPPIDDAR